jgi:DNA-binding transcriptional LysR family regulator
VDPVWAGFWRLDDHRGRPAPNMTPDTVQTVPEMLAVVASGQAVTTLPACHVETILTILPGTVAVQIPDVRPAVLSLLWPRQSRNGLVSDLVAIGNEL